MADCVKLFFMLRFILSQQNYRCEPVTKVIPAKAERLLSGAKKSTGLSLWILISLIIFSYTFTAYSKATYCPTQPLTIEVKRLKRKNNKVLFGKLDKKEIVLGFVAWDLSDIDVSLASRNNMIEMAKHKFISPGVFNVTNTNKEFQGKLKWELQILDNELRLLDKVGGTGILPKKIIWQKKNKINIIPNKSYFYKLKISRIDNKLEFTTKPKSFIITLVSTTKFKIPLKMFSNYKNVLKKKKFKRFIKKITKKIKANSDETINLIVHLTKEQTSLCSNVFRLRNHLTVKTQIPIKQFKLFCEVTLRRKPKRQYIQIIGAKPNKKVDIVKFEDKELHSIKINGREFDIEKDGFFIVARKKNNPVLEVDFKTGEKLIMKKNLSKMVVNLKRGKNRIKRKTIFLGKGPNDIYCGKIKARYSYLSLGFGPYLISDTFVPKDFRLGMVNIDYLNDFNTFLPGIVKIFNLNPRKFSFLFELFVVPPVTVGISDFLQGIYEAYIMMGYESKYPTWSLRIFLGYFIYYTKETYTTSSGKSTTFSSRLYAPSYALDFKLKNKIFGKFYLNNMIKVSPFLLAQPASFLLENNLVLSLPLRSDRYLYLKYKKNYLRYLGARKQVLSENIDAFIFGYRFQF